jgi:CxxC motif-containing protein
MKKHTFICIKCPLSCEIELIEEDKKILEIRGHTCKQGEKYVTDEFTNPVRILTTTIRVKDGILPVLPVRSTEPIPKDLMKECVKVLNAVEVKASVTCGDIVCKNILDTGVDIVAARNLEEKNKL